MGAEFHQPCYARQKREHSRWSFCWQVFGDDVQCTTNLGTKQELSSQNAADFNASRFGRDSLACRFNGELVAVLLADAASDLLDNRKVLI